MYLFAGVVSVLGLQQGDCHHGLRKGAVLCSPHGHSGFVLDSLLRPRQTLSSNLHYSQVYSSNSILGIQIFLDLKRKIPLKLSLTGALVWYLICLLFVLMMFLSTDISMFLISLNFSGFLFHFCATNLLTRTNL